MKIDFRDFYRCVLDKSDKVVYNIIVGYTTYAGVAQLVVQLIRNEQVAGSNPVTSLTLGEPQEFFYYSLFTFHFSLFIFFTIHFSFFIMHYLFYYSTLFIPCFIVCKLKFRI